VEVEPSDFHRLKCISRDDRWSRLTGGASSRKLLATSTPIRSSPRG
jgi:hypothetical protein